MIPCSYWDFDLLCSLTLMQSLICFPFVRPEICLHLPSDSTSRQTPLVFGYILPATGRIRDFHPLERAPAGRTQKTPPACGRWHFLNPCTLFNLCLQLCLTMLFRGQLHLLLLICLHSLDPVLRQRKHSPLRKVSCSLLR